MKNRSHILIATALALFFLSACLNRNDKEKNNNSVIEPAVAPLLSRDTANLTKIEWLDTSKHLGTVQEGQVVKVVFRFKNVGEKPLVLERVQPGCGCTVADYPKAPIAPGKTAEVTASFDSKGREGNQQKYITVYANTEEYTKALYFDVMVEKKEVK